MAAGELPWLGTTLAEAQRAALRGAGLGLQAGETQAIADALGRGEAVVVFREDTAFTADAVRALVGEGARRGVDLRFSLTGESGRLAAALALGREESPLTYLAPNGTTADIALRISAAPPAELDPRERLLPFGFKSPTGDDVRVALTDRLALPAGHWLQLLWANLLGLGPSLWRALLSPSLPVALLKLGAASLASCSVDPWRVGAELVRTGRGCRVHPRAVVEASVLGDGVQIGAGAIVRGCVVADGAIIEDQALVEGCVISAGVRVQRKAMVKYAVLAARSVAAGIMQLGVLGPDAVLKYGGILMDVNFNAGVRVRVGEGLAPAPFGMAGVCLGRGSTVATGVHVAPGRVIPPGLTVVADTSTALRVIPDGLSGLVEVRDGRLVQR